MLSNFRVEAEGFPSAKAAVAIDSLIALSQSAAGASPTNSAGDTGWVDVLETRIKTSSQKDLVFDVALQCGIVTDTTVQSVNGSKSSSTARANIAVRVLVDGEAAEPQNSIDALKGNCGWRRVLRPDSDADGQVLGAQLHRRRGNWRRDVRGS